MWLVSAVSVVTSVKLAPNAWLWRGGEYGGPAFPRKNWIWWRCNFKLRLTVGLQSHFHLKVWLEFEFETFCTVKSPNYSQFLPTPTQPSLFLCKPGRTTRPIFSKVGVGPLPLKPLRGSASGSQKSHSLSRLLRRNTLADENKKRTHTWAYTQTFRIQTHF